MVYRPRLLLSQRVSHTLSPPDTIVPYSREAGFGDTVPLRDFTFDNALIKASVKRWHAETHAFHLPWGEVTITLQDVEYHLRLRVHGTLLGTEMWQLVEQLLGARPLVAPQLAAHEAHMAAGLCLPDTPTDDPETL
ncbi:hypothetical protein Ahy_B01g056098 [Arachis hypogaea]|uniref:Aminotransferase-like plant mobile domain-containing protein n=1 Tax=Arachis hypogaea TaxID=3818 RepID=A0A445AY46_ARAHY|nr:hypothetical protein Ahy_B01g056098 [Arachis hypogaea]